ncbi:hypothetical protein K9U39_12790 [Rhodoblastus acidophilus]|uniref:Uncharacterized protein n=1 Tax=Candidatus Rhodoblastus alkanivorans TaxID=2954117 RepID=A0ABS9ZAP0_9HYPH|nr:hypothetical protein [Candidatus Rhodoblastus alkanivorans]MCI4677133.1 hypothetical protein [Candidatus Rhodoblastus alkanivorans]MCI4684486.1 hypothetical protein [Candidatus Rhodoblastus alkanivorans]MDI4641807.1 hypothetical protein [Rhodoblastus acidophilus]
MTDNAELIRRKQAINLAVVHTDAEAFVAAFPGWLEITAFISALRAGTAEPPADGVTPKLTPQQLKSGGVLHVARDALFSFCMTASLKGDKAAIDKVDAGLKQLYGDDFPGAVALWSFRSPIAEPMSLEDHVGQAAQKMLNDEPPPPPMRAAENWTTGLRFLEKARKSNFPQEIIYPLALWTRGKWSETLEKGVAFLHHIEDNVPVLREALDEPRNDEPFIANILLKMAPAVDRELNDEAQGFLKSLARRG